jgi:hypothetical protein
MRAIFLFLVVVLMAGPVQAHELEIDGHISGTLHVDPDDTAVAGPQSTMHITLYDSDKRLSSNGCNCEFTAEGPYGTSTAKSFSFGALGSEATIHYTFPETGNYIVHVTGSPKSWTAFQTFTLDFDVSVTHGTTPEQLRNQKLLQWGVVGLGGIVGVLGAIRLTRFVKNKS